MSALFANPFFQNYLTVLLDPCKSDSHLAVSQSVNHPSKSDKVVSSVRDSYLHSGSGGKGISCRHAAAIQTQFDSPLSNVNLGLQISQFDAGRKGITTRTSHRSLLCLGQSPSPGNHYIHVRLDTIILMYARAARRGANLLIRSEEGTPEAAVSNEHEVSVSDERMVCNA